MKSGLVVMDDLPRWKKNVKCGLIVMGDLPKEKKGKESSHCNE